MSLRNGYLDGKWGMLLFSRMRTSTVDTRRRIIIMASMIRPIMLFVHLKSDIANNVELKIAFNPI